MKAEYPFAFLGEKTDTKDGCGEILSLIICSVKERLKSCKNRLFEQSGELQVSTTEFLKTAVFFEKATVCVKNPQFL